MMRQPDTNSCLGKWLSVIAVIALILWIGEMVYDYSVCNYRGKFWFDCEGI